MIHLPKRERQSTCSPPQQVQVPAQEKEEEEEDDDEDDEDDEADEHEDEAMDDEEGEGEEEEGEEGEEGEGEEAAQGTQGTQGKKRMQSERKRKDKEPRLKLRALAPSPQRTGPREKRKEMDEMLDGQSRAPLLSVRKQKTDMCSLLLSKL